MTNHMNLLRSSILIQIFICFGHSYLRCSYFNAWNSLYIRKIFRVCLCDKHRGKRFSLKIYNTKELSLKQ